VDSSRETPRPEQAGAEIAAHQPQAVNAADDTEHQCAPPDDADGRTVFYTCPVDSRTWLREPGEPPQWHEIQ
jgi:hypothetical protein